MDTLKENHGKTTDFEKNTVFFSQNFGKNTDFPMISHDFYQYMRGTG